MQGDKITPVAVGVTGHRNIVEEDKPAIKAQVIKCLKEIQALCKGAGEGGKDVPLIMLNAFAQGADMLCAEAAFELGIDVHAVLPCEKERYILSFDDVIDRGKLYGYLEKCSRQFVSPDTERCRERLKAETGMDGESYDYRQLGIYLAQKSHIIIALWDGKPPKVKCGCGTVEVIDFALDGKYFDKDGKIKKMNRSRTAVVWIKCRRQGDGGKSDIQKRWLLERSAESGKEVCSDTPPDFIKEILRNL